MARCDCVHGGTEMHREAGHRRAPVRGPRIDTMLFRAFALFLGAVVLLSTSTALAQIRNLMTDAQKDKPPVVLLANRVASWFVTGVLLIAACVWLYWWQVAPERAFEITLAVLVVTCPCALALATPVAFTVAIGALARRGLLLRRVLHMRCRLRLRCGVRLHRSRQLS